MPGTVTSYFAKQPGTIGHWHRLCLVPARTASTVPPDILPPRAMLPPGLTEREAMRSNRSSIASRRNRRRMRARMRDLAQHGTCDLAQVPRVREPSTGEREALLMRAAIAWARATGQKQWVYRDRLANHAPRLVPAASRQAGYGVGVDGSTDNPTRHGHTRAIREGRHYTKRKRIADLQIAMSQLLTGSQDSVK